MKRISGDFTRHTHHTQTKSYHFVDFGSKTLSEVQITKLKFCFVELDLHFAYTKKKLLPWKSLENSLKFS